jgi:PBP1b-binding outer membrane lipoprotein LpoB
MKNPIKVVLLSLVVITFSMIFSGCSDNNPLEKVKSMFVSDAEKSGPSDAEVIAATPFGAEQDCSHKVVQRDKQTEDGIFPVRVRTACNDGTVGEYVYHCKKVRNESGKEVWSCSQA